MLKVSLIILITSLVNCLNSEIISKNWINNCDIATCKIAIGQCAGNCYGYAECKNCLINRDEICSTCADDIFDPQSMLSINGNNYLYCDQFDFFQNNVCKMYCFSNNRMRGECKKVQSVTGCICYDNFSGFLRATINTSQYLKAVATNGNEFAVGASNGQIIIFNSYGNQLGSFSTVSGSIINSLAYLNNNDILVTGSFGTRLYSNNGNLKIVYSSEPGLAVAVLKNGDVAFSVGKTIYINNWSSSTPKLTINGHTSNVRALLVYPSGDLISGSDDQTVKVWNVLNGSLRKTLIGHNSLIRSIVLLENGDIASASNDGAVKLWNPNFTFALKTINTGSNLLSLAILPDGRLATASTDNLIKLWDKENAVLSQVLTNGHINYVNGFAVTSTKNLISVSDDFQIKIWQ